MVPFSPIKQEQVQVQAQPTTRPQPPRATVDVTHSFPKGLQSRAAALIDTTDPDGLFKNMVKIGQGATAHLFRAVEMSTGKFVAIKKFKVKVGKSGKDDDWDDIFKELDILGRCHHRYSK